MYNGVRVEKGTGIEEDEMKALRARMYDYQPSGKQLDAEQVTSRRVQLWRNGVMITAMLTLTEARQMVTERTAFVISDQAIGTMIDGINHS
jgi:hypothetical protein